MMPTSVDGVSGLFAALDTQYEEFMKAGAGLQRVELRRVERDIEIKVLGTGRMLRVDATALLQAKSRNGGEWSNRISCVVRNSGGFGTVDLVVSTMGKRIKAFWTVSSTDQGYQ